MESISLSLSGANTPFSVMIPVIKAAGVTSNEGFQQLMPEIKKNVFCYVVGKKLIKNSNKLATCFKVVSQKKKIYEIINKSKHNNNINNIS